MYKIKLKKRQIFNHKGTMTVDANFDDGVEAFNKSFVFPIDATELEVKTEVKEWIEEKEECDECDLEKDKIDIHKIKTDRVSKKEYEKSKEEYRKMKEELIELTELENLGVIEVDDPKIEKLRKDIKDKM